MKVFNISVTEQQAKSLKTLCKETGLTRSDHIRRAIDLYLPTVNIPVDGSEATKSTQQTKPE